MVDVFKTDRGEQKEQSIEDIVLFNDENSDVSVQKVGADEIIIHPRTQQTVEINEENLEALTAQGIVTQSQFSTELLSASDIFPDPEITIDFDIRLGKEHKELDYEDLVYLLSGEDSEDSEGLVSITRGKEALGGESYGSAFYYGPVGTPVGIIGDSFDQSGINVIGDGFFNIG